MTTVDAVVAGAGPYGLSVGAHLHAAGTHTRLFGRPMESWERHMPAGMLLKSEGFASSLSDPSGRLTLSRFCADRGHPYADLGSPVPVGTFAAYGRWFAAQAGVVPEEESIERIRRSRGAFLVETSTGETVRAFSVVVATGVTGLAYIPSELDRLRGGPLTHSSDHGPIDDLGGRRVAVVGAGQSALETAALLREAGAHPVIVVRRRTLAWNGRPSAEPPSAYERLRWPLSPLGSGLRLSAFTRLAPGFGLLPPRTRARLVRETLGPAGAWWLRERIEGCVEILAGHRLAGSELVGDGAVLTLDGPAGRRWLEVDHVVSATGYRVDLDRLELLDRSLREEIATRLGYPRLGSVFESTARGLFFVGLPAALAFGPLMRFVCGAGLAARRVSAEIGRRSRRRAWHRPLIPTPTREASHGRR